jgi:spore coat polysaccharide biosynthesis protein SpsF
MAKPRVVAIVQARMDSQRLPGKVLLDLAGKPVLAWVVSRARRAKGIDEVVVATSTDLSDDAIASFCKDHSVRCVRGSQHDVLDRYILAARETNADVVVRLTGDCPLIDPGMLAENLQVFLRANPPLDFAANRLPGDRTIPIGLDAEFCTYAALERVWKEAKLPHQREHVMPFFYENPDKFRILHITHSPNYGDLRWTVDTPEDLELMREIVSSFDDDTFSWTEILALFKNRPELALINSAVVHRTQHDVDQRQ